MSSEGYRKTSSNGTQARLVSIGSTRLVSLGVNKHDAAIENTVCAVASLPRSGDLPVHPQIAPLYHIFAVNSAPPFFLPTYCLPAPRRRLYHGSLGGLALLQELVGPKGDQTDGNNEDNAENDDDTRLLLGPVLALDQLADDSVAGDEGVDGGHCDRGERRNGL
jgi:hypothetical protein